MDRLIRYLPDNTGENINNLVKNEKHNLNKEVRNRVIVPYYGAYYTDSLVVTDIFSSRKLERYTDYSCVGLHSQLTKDSGKEVCSFVLIHNDKVSDSVKITYQCYGATIGNKVNMAAQMLDIAFGKNDVIPFAKLLKLPLTYKPTFHYHDIGDIDKLHYLLFQLEKTRLALLYGQNNIFVYINDFQDQMQALIERAVTDFDNRIYTEMRDLTENFNKKLFGLDNLENYPLIEEQEAIAIANNESVSLRVGDEAYINLINLSRYTAKLLELYVNKNETGLGNYKELKISPTIESLESLPLGSIAIITMDSSDSKMYPPNNSEAVGYVVRKIAFKTDKIDSLYQYVSRSTSDVYVMKITTDSSGISTTFTPIAKVVDPLSFSEKVNDHIINYNNPHLDDKRDVNLSQVENLPIATLEEVVCNMPVRKYITVSRLLSYMRRFKTGVKEPSQIYENYSVASQTRISQTLFSACGSWKDNLNVDDIALCQLIDTPAEPLPVFYSVTPDKTNQSNHDTVNFTIEGDNVSDNTTIYWELVEVTLNDYNPITTTTDAPITTTTTTIAPKDSGTWLSILFGIMTGTFPSQNQYFRTYFFKGYGADSYEISDPDNNSNKFYIVATSGANSINLQENQNQISSETIYTVCTDQAGKNVVGYYFGMRTEPNVLFNRTKLRAAYPAIKKLRFKINGITPIINSTPMIDIVNNKWWYGGYTRIYENGQPAAGTPYANEYLFVENYDSIDSVQLSTKDLTSVGGLTKQITLDYDLDTYDVTIISEQDYTNRAQFSIFGSPLASGTHNLYVKLVVTAANNYSTANSSNSNIYTVGYNSDQFSPAYADLNSSVVNYSTRSSDNLSMFNIDIDKLRNLNDFAGVTTYTVDILAAWNAYTSDSSGVGSFNSLNYTEVGGTLITTSGGNFDIFNTVTTSSLVSNYPGVATITGFTPDRTYIKGYTTDADFKSILRFQYDVLIDTWTLISVQGKAL